MSDIYDTLLDQQQAQPAAPAAPSIDIYDQILDGERQAAQRAMQPVLDMASKIQPERAASAQGLAKSTGLPVEIVERNFEEVQRREQIRNMQDILGRSPVLARQMMDPEFAKLAHQDLEPLSGIEGVATFFKNSGRAMVGGLYDASAGVVGVGQSAAELLQFATKPLAGRVLPVDVGGMIARDLSAYRQGIEAEAKRWTPQADGVLSGGWYSGLSSLSRNLASLPLLFAPGGQGAALAGMTLPVAGAEYGKARDAGLGVGPALTFGASQGLIEYATELIPVTKLLGDLKAGASLPRMLANQIAAEIPGEQVATILQDLNEWAAIDANAGKAFGDYLAERPSAAAQTLIATIVGAAGQTTIISGIDAAMRRAAGEQRQAEQAENMAQRLAELVQFSRAAALTQTSPETFQQFVEQATDDGPVTDVFIDANVLMQSGVAEQLAAVSPAVAEQLQDAIDTGGLVRIPVAEFAARIAPTEFADGLLEHLKTEPDGMSRAEAGQYLQGQVERLQQELGDTIEQTGAALAERVEVESVRNTIRDELNAINRFRPEVNEAYATLVGEFFGSMAQRVGMTPEQLFEKYRLRTVAESVAGGQQFDQTGRIITDTPAFRAWFGDSKVVDAQGKPLVVYHGTTSEFATFAPNSHLGTASQANAIMNYEQRRGEGSQRLLPVYLRIENPKRVDDAADWQDEVEQAKAEGYDGLVYANWGEFDPDADGNPRDSYVAFRPEQIKSATGNNGNFDPSDPNILNQSGVGQPLDAVRSAWRASFNPATNTIALLQAADLSSFLHESGHFFLEVMTDMAASVQTYDADQLTEGERGVLRDVQALMRWFGLRDINEWAALDFEEKRAYHEKFAESFELYLTEGNAPSIELQPLFGRFRAWLLNVYRSIKDFLARNPAAGELSDDVRRVFDRMLATDQAIKTAEQARSLMPLFASAQQAGMTEEEFAAYQALGHDATEAAQEDLGARGMRDMQWLAGARSRALKRLQKEAAALREQMEMEARREVLSQPVYRAWQFLTGKLTADDRLPKLARPKSDPDVVDPALDSLFVAVAKLGGIDRAELEAQWGLDPKEKIAQQGFGKHVLRRNGGRSIDDMRAALVQYGYLDANEGGADWNPREFEDRFFEELAGAPQYSSAADFDALQDMRPGDQVANIGGLMAGRLDRAALTEIGLPAEIIEHLRGLRMTAKDGLHPDLVAELFGFSSGDELVRTLAAAQPPAVEIEALTDLRMIERHGDLASPEALARAADRAIHNDVRARMVATELDALAKATGRPRVMMQAAREYARQMVDRLLVRNVKPGQYAAAEARAGKAATQAMKAGDLEQAAAEKRNQLVQNQAARAAHRVLDEIEAGLRYLKKFDGDGTRKSIDTDYLEQIDTLLERFDLRKGQSMRAIDKRTALAKWIEERANEGTEPDIPEWLQAEAARTHYKNLTVEQFRGLVDSVRQIEHLGRLKNKLLTARDARALDAIVAEITASMEAAADGRTIDNERRNTLASQVQHAARGFMAMHRQMHSLVREMDGYQDGGPLWNVLVRTMNEAGEREASMRADATRRLHALIKPLLAEGGKMGGKGQYFPSLGRSLNRGERLAIALNWGNEGNRQRLLDGRGWTAERVMPVLQTLTPAEWQFVQGVWDFFESYRPQVAEKEKRVTGKEPEWIEPAPFTIEAANGGTMSLRGGYYPIKYDPMQSGEAESHNEAEAGRQMMRAAYTAATTRRSYTKGRADRVMNRPLLLSFDGIYQGANEVIHDLSWHEWLIDANKILRRLDAPMRQHFGAEKVTAIKRAMKDIAAGDQPATNAFERILGHLRSGATIAGLGWNLRTALLQPLGLTNSIVRVGPAWIARGLREFYGSPAHMARKVEEAQAKSEFLRNRMRTMNREINDVVNRLDKGKSDLQLAIESSFFILIQKTQALVDYPTWYGAFEKAMADPALRNEDGTIDEARAVAMADQAVIAAQSGGQAKDLAQIQRGGPLLKLFTNFYSYFAATLQLAVERTGQTNFKKPHEVLRLAGDYLLLMVVPVIGSVLINALMKGAPDDDEWVEQIIEEQIGFLMGFFPLTREMTSAVQAATGFGGQFGYSGPAGLRFFSDLYRLGAQVGQGEFDMAAFKAANNTAGVLFHYPAGQVNRTVEGTAALLEGRTDNPLAVIAGPPPRN
jgi:hypothetical protein